MRERARRRAGGSCVRSAAPHPRRRPPPARRRARSSASSERPETQRSRRLLQRDETAEWYEGGLFGGEAVELGLKEDITSKFTVSIRGPWSDPDLTDLQAALALLTAAELKWVSGTEFVRVGSIAGRPDDDALTEVVG